MKCLWSCFLSLILTFGSIYATDTDTESSGEQSKSLAKAAPQLFYLMNHSPYVFGLPGTESGDFFSRTQLTGDWGGTRTALVNGGIYIDIYSTTGFQGVLSGGIGKAGVFSQSTDLTINLDTTQMNLWPGAVIHLNLQSRYGSSSKLENREGTLVPTNGAWLFPVVGKDNLIAPTEYYVLQALSEKQMVLFGKTDALYLADQNIFASNYRYQFMNCAFQANAILGQYFHPVAWLGGHILQITPEIRVITAIVDPYSSPLNFAKDAFKHIGILQEFDFTYTLGKLPGTAAAGWVWSNAPRVDLSNPLKIDIFGGSNFAVSTRKINYASAVYCNFAQYLVVTDDPATVAAKAKLSLPPRGIGIFGRLGGGSKKSNVICLFGSLGISGMGPFDCRPLDQFGVGWYYAHISPFFKCDIKRIIEIFDSLGGHLKPIVKDEQGIEAYYSFAITPAMQLTADFQHVWNPLKANFLGHDYMTMLGARLQVSF